MISNSNKNTNTFKKSDDKNVSFSSKNLTAYSKIPQSPTKLKSIGNEKIYENLASFNKNYKLDNERIKYYENNDTNSNNSDINSDNESSYDENSSNSKNSDDKSSNNSRDSQEKTQQKENPDVTTIEDLKILLYRDTSLYEFRQNMEKLKNYTRNIKCFLYTKRGELEEATLGPNSELMNFIDNNGLLSDGDVNNSSQKEHNTINYDKIKNQMNNSETRNKEKFYKLLSKLTIYIVISSIVFFIVFCIEFYYGQMKVNTTGILHYKLLKEAFKAIDLLFWSSYLLSSNILLSKGDFTYNRPEFILLKPDLIKTNTQSLQITIDEMLLTINVLVGNELVQLNLTEEHLKILNENTIKFFTLDKNGDVAATQYSSLIDILKTVIILCLF